MSWYDTSYRKLFYDFHSPGNTVGLASGYDPERWAERQLQAHAQGVSVFTKCGFGYSYYRKGSVRYVHPHLPAGTDMLGEQIEALHRRGIRALGYYHTFNSEPVARDHPDWLMRDAEGKPQGISICLLGPLLDEWMLPHVAEIVTLYDIDSMFFDGTYGHLICHCPSCQERFAQDTGGLALPADEHDANWPRYAAWSLAAHKVVRQRICDTIHAHRPEVPVSFNWCYTQRMPEAVPEGVGTLMADIFPDDQAFNSSYLARFWAMLERPYDIMNSAFLQWWGDWGCKPAVAMQQEVATVIAQGGLTWIGYQMNEKYDVEPAVMGELGKTLAFVQEREGLLEGAQPVPYVAVLQSTSAYWASDEIRLWVDEASPRGAHRLLTESMIPYHMLHEETLLRRLDEFRVVILPDQRYLPAELVGALGKWVQSGGVLLSLGLTGTLDEAHRPTGRFALEELLGVRYEGAYEQSHAYVEITDARLEPGTLDMAHMAECRFALARPVAPDVEQLARLRRIYLRADGKFLLSRSPVGEDSGYPAVTARRVGQGWAVYVAGDLFRAYQVRNQWNLKHIVANLLHMLVEKPLVQVQAPAWLEVVLMRQPDREGGRTLVHLVNHHGNRPVDKNNVCVEQVLPVRGITVHLACDSRPARVTLEPQGTVADWRYADGLLEVAVPEVLIHSAIAVAW